MKIWVVNHSNHGERANASGINCLLIEAETARDAVRLANERASRNAIMSGDRFDTEGFEVLPLAALMAKADGVLTIKGRLA